MFIDLTAEQRKLQSELREYFSTLITPEEAAAMETDRHNEAYRAVIKRMGSDGKLGVGWPKEYGGLGFGPIEQQIFINEANRADIPLPMVTLQTVGPTLQLLGTEMATSADAVIDRWTQNASIRSTRSSQRTDAGAGRLSGSPAPG